MDMQHSLFPSPSEIHTFQTCRIEHHPALLQALVEQVTVDNWFDRLKASLLWKQDTITIFGKSHLIPRYNAWYGDEDTAFGYSGIPLEPNGWTSELLSIRTALERYFDVNLNSVLANWYRDGNDKMGWHADDEPQMCKVTPIVSVSLGVPRKMQFKSKDKNNRERLQVLLGHGDVLVMHPPTQELLKHCIPVMKRVTEGRVNLTFRHCHPAQ